MDYLTQNGKQVKTAFGSPREIDPVQAKKTVVNKLRNLLVLAEREEYAKLENAFRFITGNPNRSELVSLITSVHESLEVEEHCLTDEDEEVICELSLGWDGDDVVTSSSI